MKCFRINHSNRLFWLVTLTGLLSVMAVSRSLQAETYWIYSEASEKGTGSKINPFSSFQTALNEKGGGNTFVFKPGTYTGQINLYEQHKGTPQKPTVLKSEQKLKAVLHGSLGHNIYVHRGCEWVIIDGFESSGAKINGIKSNADYTIIRNCWIHHNAGQGIGAHSVTGSVFERNLIEYNGSHLQFDHGIYADGDNLIIRQNVVRFSSARGLQLAGKSQLKNSLILNNLIYGNTRQGLLVFCPNNNDEENANKIINNTIVYNGYGITVQNFNGGVIANNIILDNTRWRYFDGNPVISTSKRISSSEVKFDSLEDLKKIRITHNLVDENFKKLKLSDDVFENNIVVEISQVYRCFVYSRKGIFYLKKSSPAVGKADPSTSAENDFFGNPRPDKAPDIGCYNYYESLDDAEKFDENHPDWYYGWPFYFKSSASSSLDLWKEPTLK